MHLPLQWQQTPVPALALGVLALPILSWRSRGGALSQEKSSYINAYMWNIEKWYRGACLQGRNRDCRCREQTCGRRGGWRGWDELGGYTTLCTTLCKMGFPGALVVKEPACQWRRHKRRRFNPWVGKTPWGGHGNLLQYSCLENPMVREEPGGLQSVGSQRVKHDWSNLTHMHACIK